MWWHWKGEKNPLNDSFAVLGWLDVLILDTANFVSG
jgi:hypothetical protein